MSAQGASEYLALEMRTTLSNSGPPTDTMERALWRMETILAGFYDERQIEPEQCLGDLMTDIMHWCNENQVDLMAAAERGAWMVTQERADWGIPPLKGDEPRDLLDPDEREI
jgi:hypothetical protein